MASISAQSRTGTVASLLGQPRQVPLDTRSYWRTGERPAGLLAGAWDRVRAVLLPDLDGTGPADADQCRKAEAEGRRWAVDEQLARYRAIFEGLRPRAAAGFFRIRAPALRLMIEHLHLPLCNLDWGRGCWPFFQPLITEAVGGKPHYLGEDWAFSHRLRQVGITPLADATIRLYHFGRYGFSWEEAGDHRPRNRSYRFRP